MNFSDRKNLYSALDQAADNEMNCHQPPAYQPNQPQMQQVQQSVPSPSTINIPVNGRPSAQRNDIIMMATPQVGPNPMVITCPHCHARAKTSIRYSSTAKTHIACLLLSCTMCCCIPYCMKSCQNTNHYCSMCDAFIGSYRS